MLTIGSLFSGIGGLELGLEWAGLGPVVWQCEIDPFCRAVLAKHWPNVTRFEDVTARREYPTVDLLCGGFPCTDVSSAGKRRGLGGQSSGLWYHFARVVEQLAPAWVVVENVASGARRWLRPVRHQLHLFGYRTRALGVAARDVGAPHRRSRVFVIAHADPVASRQQGRGRRTGGTLTVLAALDGRKSGVADDDGTGRDERSDGRPGPRREGGRASPGCGSEIGRAWATEPDVGRVAHGVPARMDRLAALGNAVVPQCAQVVGEVIQQMCALDSARKEMK